MHKNARVVLTDTSISIVSSRDVFMTSIPLRTWVKVAGNHWISRLRRNHEVKYLVKRLNAVLNANDQRSLMECISEVMKKPIPAAPQKKEATPERTQKTIIKKFIQIELIATYGGGPVLPSAEGSKSCPAGSSSQSDALGSERDDHTCPVSDRLFRL